MSLNSAEQALFDYWHRQPDERRHWHDKVSAASRESSQPGELARALDRELWEHFLERSRHVPQLAELNAGGLRRISMLNLAEYLIRLWGPPPKPKDRKQEH